MEPLLRMVFLGEGGEGDFVFGVVLLHQIFDDSAGFPDSNVGVGIVNCGSAAVKGGLAKFSLFFYSIDGERKEILPAIGIHIRVWLFLDGFSIEISCLIRNPEFFEDNDHLHCHYHCHSIIMSASRSLITIDSDG